MIAEPLDDIGEHLHVVRERGSDIVDVLTLKLHVAVVVEVNGTSDRNAAECLSAFGNHVGVLLDVLVSLFEEARILEELRDLDVPVVLLELVSQFLVWPEAHPVLLSARITDVSD